MNFINAMQDKKENKFKIILDNILIYNLYILIGGALFLLSSFILSINGESKLFGLFQKLWYPVFIPSLSLFFTAIFVEAILNRIIDRRTK